MRSNVTRVNRFGYSFLSFGVFLLLCISHVGCSLFCREQMTCSPPKRAVVLFDGSGFSQWTHTQGGPVQWEIVDNAMKVVPGTDSIMTLGIYQDFQLHVEFNVPKLPRPARGQSRWNRGNSGVYLQRRYEVQILDSFEVGPEAYDCGSLYNARPPDINASREAGEWQSFNITFYAPRFEGEGDDLKKIRNARITVRHNGTVVHDDVELEGKTGTGRPEGPEPGPILLQDHGNEVMFRNIWILPLERSDDEEIIT